MTYKIKPHETRAEGLERLRALYAGRGSDMASVRGPIVCCDAACDRPFLEFDTMVEHAEAVHTFNDIERLVAEAVREKYAKPGNYEKKPPVQSIWAWTVDLAEDWVVFNVEKGSDSTLLKASYTLVDGVVTLGEPVEVKRRTVYDPVVKAS